MEPAWQDMDEEAADELIGRKRHDLLLVGAIVDGAIAGRLVAY